MIDKYPKATREQEEALTKAFEAAAEALGWELITTTHYGDNSRGFVFAKKAGDTAAEIFGQWIEPGPNWEEPDRYFYDSGRFDDGSLWVER